MIGGSPPEWAAVNPVSACPRRQPAAWSPRRFKRQVTQAGPLPRQAVWLATTQSPVESEDNGDKLW